jgi:crossover junction endodeoxyribonuclease RuvC
MRIAAARNTNGVRAPQVRLLRVLGLDPAAAGPTGYGIVETDGRDCRMLHFGALPAASRAGRGDFAERLRTIHELVCGLIEEYAPDAVAVESVFTALNMRTALLLAEVRGVVQLAAAQRHVPISSYSPREVKACVAGYGHANKEQMQLMVRAMLGMRETPEPSDAADALAVALCHIHTSNARARIAAAIAPRPARSAAAAGQQPRRTNL